MNILFLFLFLFDITAIKKIRICQKKFSFTKIKLQSFETFEFKKNLNTSGCDERINKTKKSEEIDINKLEKLQYFQSVLKDLENKNISNNTKLKIIEGADIFGGKYKSMSLNSGGLFDDFLMLIDL